MAPPGARQGLMPGADEPREEHLRGRTLQALRGRAEGRHGLGAVAAHGGERFWHQLFEGLGYG